MNTFNLFSSINLQLFGEGGGAGGGAGAGAGATGGEGGTGATGTQTAEGSLATTSKNGSKNPLASVIYGKQADGVVSGTQGNEPNGTPIVSPEERVKQFEALIKGEYKDLYDARVQDTVQKRLKSTKDTVDRFNSLTPTLELLAKKYGVSDVNDIDALTKAIEEDDSYYEDEALEKGISVEQLKYIKKMEKENAALKAQTKEEEMRRNADRIYAKWLNDGEALKAKYPNFNFETEMQNEKFVDLLRNNVDVETAFTVVHKDEIIPAAMQYTAKQVEQKIANKVIANGSRPTENGLNGGASAVVKTDVSQFSKADRDEIARRVARGEKIIL